MNHEHLSEAISAFDEWRHGIVDLTTNNLEMYVKAVFDHDYQYHILTTVHVRNGRNFDFWGHILFFVGADISGDYLPTANIVAKWEGMEHSVPFVESAQIVNDWLDLLVATNGMWND